MVFINGDAQLPFEIDFRIYLRNSEMTKINLLLKWSDLSKSKKIREQINGKEPLRFLTPYILYYINIDPIIYELFHSHGEPGWQPGMDINLGMVNINRYTLILTLEYKVKWKINIITLSWRGDNFSND